MQNFDPDCILIARDYCTPKLVDYHTLTGSPLILMHALLIRSYQERVNVSSKRNWLVSRNSGALVSAGQHRESVINGNYLALQRQVT